VSSTTRALGPRVDVHVHRTDFWPTQPNALYRADLVNSVESLLHEMDDHAVGYAVSIPYAFVPSPEVALEEGREQLALSHGRLRPVGSTSPTLGEAAVAHAIELWEKIPELVALKLFPGYFPFYPHDRRLEPVYEFAHRRNLPVLLHQGDTLAPDGLIKYARPLEVDEVAVRYRDVRFVLCHLGNPWISETAEIVYKNPNVYTDTSGLLGHPTLRYFGAMFEQAQHELERLLLTIGDGSRVLFGSDWPLVSLELSVRLIAGLPIAEDEKERILGGNARALFRLPAP
jgi:predicted TIM-barrel fold metal-dependent hydrolase